MDPSAHRETSLESPAQEAEAHYQRGYAFQQRFQYGAAIEAYLKAISCRPDHAQAHFQAALILEELGLAGEATKHYRAAVEAEPRHLLARWGAALTLPHVYDDDAEIERYGRQWEQGIRRLLDEVAGGPRLDPAVALSFLSWKTNFYLHYQGLDHTALQRLFGRFVSMMACSACPEYCRPLPKRTLEPGERLRVGFVSGFFLHHTITKLFGGSVRELSRERFEVHLLDVGGRAENIGPGLRKNCELHALGALAMPALVQRVRDLALDILVYLDVGMHPKIQPLAALRLAPVQCCAWGHPVTTGLDTIDYFLSSELMEPDGGEAHYSEKLIRLPNLSICYDFPELASGGAGAANPEGPPLFLCTQSLFKLIPQHDALFARIARRVPNAQFWFLEDKSSLSTDKFRRRLGRAFAAHGLDAERQVFVKPRVPESDFFALHREATAVLDSPAWSGGNTSLEALACGKPIVTSPGPMMRGRHTTGILRRAGLGDLVARDAEEYVEIAVRLALDVPWRRAVEEQVRIRKHAVYHDVGAVRALEEFLAGSFTQSLPSAGGH